MSSESPPPKFERPKITHDQVAEAINIIIQRLDERIQEKGEGSFLSTHEILGVLSEEHSEVEEAVFDNDPQALESELEDMAVGSIFALACLRAGHLHW